MRRLFAFLLVVCSLVCGIAIDDAHARPNAKAAAQAQQAAREAKQHQKKGDLQAARQAWQRALEHDEKPAFKLALASVEADLGNLRQAAALLEQMLDGPRGGKQKQAAQALKKLEQRIPTLRLSLPEGFDGEVTLDDRTLAAADLAEPIRLDPGEHLLQIEAPGYLAFEKTLRLEEGERHKLRPKLQKRAHEQPSEPEPEPAPVVVQEDSGTPGLRVAGIVSLVVGAIGVGVGTGFGLASKSTRDDLSEACQNDVCGPEQRETYDRGRQQADIATAGFVVGGIGLGAGAVMLLLSPSKTEREQPAKLRARPLIGYRSVGARVDF